MDQGRHAAEKKPTILSTLLSLVMLVAFVLVLSWALRTFVFQAYEIPSGSMETTIMTKDMVFSEKVTYYTRDVQQGDIVTFIDPTDSSRTLIKRVIAVGGQEVDLKNGKVYVDGEALDEPYTNGLPSEELPGSNVTFPYKVKEGYLWCMGDNRTNSQDSRWFGAVKASTVTGKAFVIYWPLDRIRLLS